MVIIGIGAAISIFILYWIIISAINSSELAKDLKEIKEMLNHLNSIKPKERLTKTTGMMEQDLILSNPEAVLEECPGCNEQVLSTDMACSSCGLTLREDY